MKLRSHTGKLEILPIMLTLCSMLSFLFPLCPKLCWHNRHKSIPGRLKIYHAILLCYCKFQLCNSLEQCQQQSWWGIGEDWLALCHSSICLTCTHGPKGNVYKLGFPCHIRHVTNTMATILLNASHKELSHFSIGFFIQVTTVTITYISTYIVEE